MTGCTSKECAVEAGQLLGVGKIIVGSVSIVGKTYLLSLSLVNVETGKVELVEDQECKCEVDDLIQLSKQVAGKLMGTSVAEAVTTPAVTPAEVVLSQKPECIKANKKFCDHGDGTVNDKMTGLIWQHRDDGQERNWNDAISWCQNLQLAGKIGWRLPDINELRSLVDSSLVPFNEVFSINVKGSFLRDSFYLSSTTHERKSSFAWCVDFLDYLQPYYCDKMKTSYVRCVR